MEKLVIEILGDVPKSGELAALLEEAYSKVTDHWKKLLPKFKVVLVDKTFDQIEKLKDQVAEIREMHREDHHYPIPDEDHWKMSQSIILHGQEKVIYMRMDWNSIMSSPEYEFKKDFLSEIAGLLMSSPNLAEVCLENSTGIARASNSQILALTAFRSAFKRYFINPEWLEEKKEDAYRVMRRLDLLAEEGTILPAV